MNATAEKYRTLLTDAEWPGCVDPIHLFVHIVQFPPSPKGRKHRLFSCACVRRVLGYIRDVRSRRLLQVLEQHVEDAATEEEVEAAFLIVREANLNDAAAVLASEELLLVTSYAATARTRESPSDSLARDKEEAAQCDLFRDIFGNPFRQLVVDPSWLTFDVLALARGIYEAWAFDRMPILADALQDAGCENADILNHLRDPNATHVRGCWALDLILGKE